MKRLMFIVVLLCALVSISTRAQTKKGGRAHAKQAQYYTCKINITATPEDQPFFLYNSANSSRLIPINLTNDKFSYLFNNSSFSTCRKGDVIVIDCKDEKVYCIADAHSININLTTQELSGSESNKKLCEAQKAIAAANNAAAKKAIAIEAIKANKNNPIAAILLTKFLKQFNYTELSSIIQEGGSCLKHALCNNATSWVNRAPGQKMKDLELQDTLGTKHKLTEYITKGNYTLFDFWASWCIPCLEEMPYVKANYNKYKSQGFKVVGISLDNKAEAWKKCIVKREFDWVQLSDLKGWDTAVHDPYGITSIPANILCDGKGNIIATDLRGDALGQKLEELYCSKEK